ncbi:MAG TPA: porin family protein [Puia sp.]|jgi:hypothetical protein
MKKLAALVLLSLLGKITSAQILIAVLFGDKLNTDKLEFGLVVSPSLTNITGIDGNYKPAVNLGLYFNIKLTDRLFLSPQAIAKASFGAKNIPPYPTGNDSLDYIFAKGSVQRNIQALSLPLMIHYRITGRLFAEGGFQADLLLKAKDNFRIKSDDDQLVYTTKVTDKLRRLDLGATGGLTYKFKTDKGMGVGIRYLYGLTDIIKPQTGSQVNSVWLLNITIPIGSGKSGQQPG